MDLKTNYQVSLIVIFKKKLQQLVDFFEFVFLKLFHNMASLCRMLLFKLMLLLVT